jgi:uncharacterized protein YneF (UPF0154 family)
MDVSLALHEVGDVYRTGRLDFLQDLHDDPPVVAKRLREIADQMEKKNG